MKYLEGRKRHRDGPLQRTLLARGTLGQICSCLDVLRVFGAATNGQVPVLVLNDTTSALVSVPVHEFQIEK
jgi:hypothetical protein